VSSETTGRDADERDEQPTRSDAGGTTGYVHRPDGTQPAPQAATGSGTGASDAPEMGVRGWVLVGVVVLCVLVIPGVIYLRPSAPTRIGWGFFATMLALPMLPALLLGATAVWSMTAGHTGDDRE
jgi:hypothetical protein